MALAAADYFFNNRVKRTIFENFTNLVPMERKGSLRKSLEWAFHLLEQGYNVLIFPEGTRSRTGVMQPFQRGIGHLVLRAKVGILPMHLSTYEALPPGTWYPQSRQVSASIGPFLDFDTLLRVSRDLSRSDSERAVARTRPAHRRARAGSRAHRPRRRSREHPLHVYRRAQSARARDRRKRRLRSCLPRLSSPVRRAFSAPTSSNASRWGDTRVLCRGDAPEGIEDVVEGSILDEDAVKRAVDGVDTIYHLAGRVSRNPDDVRELYRVHVDGTVALCRGAASAGVRRIVLASTSGTIAVRESDDVIPDETAPVPLELIGAWPYYTSKLYQEEAATRECASGPELVILNPSLLLGPRG